MDWTGWPRQLPVGGQSAAPGDPRNQMTEAPNERDGRNYVAVFAYLADEAAEGLVDVDSELGRRFDEWAFKSPRELTALLTKRASQSWDILRGRRGQYTTDANLTLELQIALIGDNDDGEVVLILDLQNELLEVHGLFERVSRGHRVHKQDALSGTYIRCPHGTTFK
jgi:hypothetical protein